MGPPVSDSSSLAEHRPHTVIASYLSLWTVIVSTWNLGRRLLLRAACNFYGQVYEKRVLDFVFARGARHGGNNVPMNDVEWEVEELK